MFMDYWVASQIVRFGLSAWIRWFVCLSFGTIFIVNNSETLALS